MGKSNETNSVKKTNFEKEAVAFKKNKYEMFKVIGVIIACIALLFVIIGVSNSNFKSNSNTKAKTV